MDWGSTLAESYPDHPRFVCEARTGNRYRQTTSLVEFTWNVNSISRSFNEFSNSLIKFLFLCVLWLNFHFFEKLNILNLVFIPLSVELFVEYVMDFYRNWGTPWYTIEIPKYSYVIILHKLFYDVKIPI